MKCHLLSIVDWLYTEWFLTEVDKICVFDMSDLVEAAIKMGGAFGQGRDLIQAYVLTVHTPTNTHTQ